jgi:hypothetical protein
MSGDDLLQFTSLSLSDAVLCANCDMISNSTNECRCCGSTATISLVALLGTLSGGSTAKVVDREWVAPREVPKIRPQRVA